MAGADISSYLIAGLVIKRASTVQSLIVSLIIAAVGAILYLLFYKHVEWIPVFIVLCRVGIGMLVNILYVSNNRFFPIQFQSSSFGLLNFISHITAVGAPLVAEIEDPYPYFVFIANVGVAFLATLGLREIS